MEILEIYEEKAKEDNKLFKEIVKDAEEIEAGERNGTWTEELSLELKRFEKIKLMCKDIMWLSSAKIRMINNKKLEEDVIKYLKATRKHIDVLLRLMGEEELINVKDIERIKE